MSSLCVNATYCKQVGKVPRDGECREPCPLIFSERYVYPLSNTDRCAFECPSTEVDSLATSDLLRGCRVIIGDLNIKLSWGGIDAMETLKRNLGEIEEITGRLKIYRSPLLTSLKFLSNLRIIRGQTNSDDNTLFEKYTFSLLSNDNLQELWDFNEKKDLKLERGNLIVHYNMKLCQKHIVELQKLLKTNASADYIDPESNGYEQSCTVRTIVTSNTVLNCSSVEIKWDKVLVDANEKVVGYIIYYIVAPARNITHVGLDTCVNYAWHTHFIQNNLLDPKSTSHTTLLTNLEPNTQYAFYVKAQVVQKVGDEEKPGALGVSQGQSNIEYFTTSADVPSPPWVQTLTKTHDSITLAWHSIYDTERVDYFKMDLFIQPDEHEVLDSRDYCLDPRIEITMAEEAPSQTSQLVYERCRTEYETWKINNPNEPITYYEWKERKRAECNGTSTRTAQEEEELLLVRLIENFQLYESCRDGKKCVNEEDIESYRFSREIHDLVHKDKSRNYQEPEEEDDTPYDLGSNHLYGMTFKRHINNETIGGLKPYTMYIFQVFSCLNYNNCSAYFFHFDRTDSQANADDVELTVSIDALLPNRVHLDFDEPHMPNGLTVAFEVEKHDSINYKVTTVCITRKKHYANGRR